MAKAIDGMGASMLAAFQTPVAPITVEAEKNESYKEFRAVLEQQSSQTIAHLFA
jgi:hypothetical protein